MHWVFYAARRIKRTRYTLTRREKCTNTIKLAKEQLKQASKQKPVRHRVCVALPERREKEHNQASGFGIINFYSVTIVDIKRARELI
jgi:hypothetical protein